MRASAPPAARACTGGLPKRSRSLYGEDPGEHLSELALHWRLAAVSVDKAKAADYALRAGQRALESLAPAEAVKLFADAVELIGDVDSAERCEALIGLGEAQLQSGRGRLPRDAARGLADRLRPRGRRARRESGAGEQPRRGLKHVR